MSARVDWSWRRVSDSRREIEECFKCALDVRGGLFSLGVLLRNEYDELVS